MVRRDQEGGERDSKEEQGFQGGRLEPAFISDGDSTGGREELLGEGDVDGVELDTEIHEGQP